MTIVPFFNLYRPLIPITPPSKSSFCPNSGNQYDCYAFIKIGFTEVKDARKICQQDRDYCPELDVDIKIFSGSRNKIEFEWEAQSKSDPAMILLDLLFITTKSLKNIKGGLDNGVHHTFPLARDSIW